MILPPELRNIVYSFLLPAYGPGTTVHLETVKPPAICQGCSLLRRETLPIVADALSRAAWEIDISVMEREDLLSKLANRRDPATSPTGYLRDELPWIYRLEEEDATTHAVRFNILAFPQGICPLDGSERWRIQEGGREKHRCLDFDARMTVEADWRHREDVHGLKNYVEGRLSRPSPCEAQRRAQQALGGTLQAWIHGEVHHPSYERGGRSIRVL
ncbi:hypothetical protein LTR85_005399 [Meristemomyces frigidus]|nr:hypothetical protein LTR85_005399 [Meristemomyces frigidus]